MTPGLGFIIVLLLGAAVGSASWVALELALHRYDDEQHLRKLPTGWIAPATALVGGGTWAAFPADAPVIVPVVYVAATWVMVSLAAVDLDVHRLPDSVQLPAYPALVLLLIFCSLATDDWLRLARSAAAGTSLLLLYLLLALLTPTGAFGFGDVKLAGLLGMLLGWLGWAQVVAATLATFLLGGVMAAYLLGLRRARLQSKFAYGPVMVLGALIAIDAPLLLRAN